MSVAQAVELEQAELTEALRNSPEASLVRELAAQMDTSLTPRDLATISREFRAALEAQREAVARAGKRGDGIDEIEAKRVARRAAAADSGKAAERQ